MMKNCVLNIAISIALFSAPIQATAQANLNDLANGLRVLNELSKLGKQQNGQRNGSKQANQQEVQQWKKIQARLNELGYAAGPVDGKPGKKTFSALAQFQARNGLSATGSYDDVTANRLFSSNAVVNSATASVSNLGQRIVCNSEDVTENVRFGPSAKKYGVKEQIPNGSKVEVVGKVTNSSGYDYLQIRYLSPNSGKTEEGYLWHKSATTACGSVAVEANANQKAEQSGERARLPEWLQTATEKTEEKYAVLRGPKQVVRNLPGSIVGLWEGTATCKRGTFFTTMLIEDADNGRFEARADYINALAPSGRKSDHLLIGEKVSENDVEFFYQGKHFYDYLDQLLERNFTVSYDAEQDRLVGSYPGDRCEGFQLERTSPDSPTKVFAIRSDNVKKSLWQNANSLPERCAVFRDWFEDVYSEYRGEDRTQLDRGALKLALLSDASLVKRFGHMLDTIPASFRNEITTGFSQCKNDPIWSARLKPYERNISSTFLWWVTSGGQHGSGYRSVEYPTRPDTLAAALRYADNQIVIPLMKAKKSSDFASASSSFATAEQNLEKYQRMILPSRNQFLENEIRSARTSVFQDQADRLVSLSLEKSTTEEQVQALFDTHERATELVGVEDPMAVSVLKRRSAEMQKKIVVEQLSSLRSAMSASDNSPNSLLSLFDLEVDKLASQSDVLTPLAHSSFEQEIASQRELILMRAVEFDLNALRQISPTAENTSQHIQWLANFSEAHEGDLETASVKNAFAEFRSIRESFLKEVFPTFKAELTSISSSGDIAAGQRALNKFLQWEHDNELVTSKPYYSELAKYNLLVLENVENDVQAVSASKNLWESREPFLEALDEAERQTYEEALIAVHTDAGQRLLDRVVVIGDIASFEELDGLHKSANKAERLFSRMIPTVGSKLKEGLSDQISSLTSKAFTLKQEELFGFEANESGLSASARWIEEVEEQLSKFSNIVSGDEIRKQFTKHRVDLLTNALGDFEERLEKISESNDTETVQDILARYLSWEGDANLPVSLDYEFTASLYE